MYSAASWSLIILTHCHYLTRLCCPSSTLSFLSLFLFAKIRTQQQKGRRLSKVEHTRDAAAAKGEWGREVSLCVCKNNLQYETRRNETRKVRRASASACTTDSAVTPAEAATAAAEVAVTVAYGGRLLRFSFGQRKYKEIWKIRCVILYVRIVRFYEHTRVFSVFFSLLFLFFLYLSKCVFCIQYWRRVCRLYMYLYVCMLRADRFVCYAEFSFPLSLRRPCVLLFCYYLFCVVVFNFAVHVHF